MTERDIPYFPKPENRVRHTHIGYLHGEFEHGEVPEGFVQKLETAERCASHIGTTGHHTCEYCYPGGDHELLSKIDNGEVSREVWKEVTSSGDKVLDKYKWPDMLRHYISTHQYQPPQDFVDFIMNFDAEQFNAQKPEIKPIKLPDFEF